MTEMKLCCDCKYYRKDWFEHLFGRGDRYDKCLNPIFDQNPVTGKTKGRYCDSMRKFHGCGMDAKYWEAK